MKTMKQKRLEARARRAWRAERTPKQQLTLIDQRKGISHRESLRLLADIATFPWAARHEWQGVDLAEFPNVKRWYDAIWARPAVKTGYDVP